MNSWKLKRKGKKNKATDGCHYVAHLTQPAQLHIDRRKQHCLALKVSKHIQPLPSNMQLCACASPSNTSIRRQPPWDEHTTRYEPRSSNARSPEPGGARACTTEDGRASWPENPSHLWRHQLRKSPPELHFGRMCACLPLCQPPACALASAFLLRTCPNA
jgi:hypothetical protein